MYNERQYKSARTKQQLGENDGSLRRIQQVEHAYKPFENKIKNNGEPIIEHSYLGMISDAQSNIRVAVEGLKQREMQGTLRVCEELILLELDIELSLLKLKNIATGRGNIK